MRALAKVGLVWALAVLAALFMAMSSQGHKPDGGYSFGAPDSMRSATSFSVDSGTAPSTAGLALALFVLAGGVTVLAVGGAREPRGPRPDFAPRAGQRHGPAPGARPRLRRLQPGLRPWPAARDVQIGGTLAGR